MGRGLGTWGPPTPLLAACRKQVLAHTVPAASSAQGWLPQDHLPNPAVSSQPSCQHLPTPRSLPAWDVPLPCPHRTDLNNSPGPWKHLGGGGQGGEVGEQWRWEGWGPALLVEHCSVPTGRTSWCWTSSSRRSTTRPLSRRKPTTLPGFSVTPSGFPWDPDAWSSMSQPRDDVGLVEEGPHRAGASPRLAEGWHAAGCPLSRMSPAPSVLLPLPL